jgi:methionyl-tRNA formyltransferase
MKILVCTKRDLAGALVLNQLMPALAGDRVMVLLSDKTRPVEKAVPELAEMKFLERDLPVDIVFPLVDLSGCDDAPFATFDGIARRFSVPIKTVTDINGPDSEAMIREFAPDLILSVRFSLIFKRNIFDIPPLGTWNVHPGALPSVCAVPLSGRGRQPHRLHPAPGGSGHRHRPDPGYRLAGGG